MSPPIMPPRGLGKAPNSFSLPMPSPQLLFLKQPFSKQPSPTSLAKKPFLLLRLVPLRPLLLRLVPLLLLMVAAGTASAQGNFYTNGPFTVSLVSGKNLTLTAIPVTYKPLNGSKSSGYLTLSGVSVGSSSGLFSGIHLAFSPTLGGPPTVTDTFPLSHIILVGGNSYSVASVGTGANGSTFNLAHGTLVAAVGKAAGKPSAAPLTRQVRRPRP